jgi:predicted GNAT family N-acyltransferase
MSERIIAVDAKSALMPAVFDLRREVFVGEQAVPPELELDEFDGTAIHLVALHDDQVIGTLRLILCGDIAKIGRVAVRAAARKTGIGSRLMDRAAALALEKGVREIVLHAQIAVADFYRRLGYVAEGGIFDEAGIPHVSMRKTIA